MDSHIALLVAILTTLAVWVVFFFLFLQGAL